jgi:hypothetical protein
MMAIIRMPASSVTLRSFPNDWGGYFIAPANPQKDAFTHWKAGQTVATIFLVGACHDAAPERHGSHWQDAASAV